MLFVKTLVTEDAIIVRIIYVLVCI